MQTVSSYGVELRKQNIPVRQTLEIYRSAVYYLTEIYEMCIRDRQFPANFISEAVDQTRGWFYSLLAESTLLFNKAPYKNVIAVSYTHLDYPHCWRCDTPLIYYARESWFIKMTAVKDDRCV